MSEMLIYQSQEGVTKIEVRLENENVWLSQQQMAELFQTTKQNISLHTKNIFSEGELDEFSVVKEYLTTAADGKNYKTKFYNLDMIISLGYRIKSQIATRFRIWATERLKEYMIKGFTMDDERLMEAGGGNYWYELLNRIRLIRASEKVLYRQVLDLYSTSMDYDPKSSYTLEFFKIVQNKLHYATHGHTAAELIYLRADSNKPFMGLRNFKGEEPNSQEITVAKNYLDEDELKILSNLVSGYFDFAEIQAMKRKPMYMKDYITQLDNILSATGENLLQDSGKITSKKALVKAREEYNKYKEKTLSPVEKHYLESIKSLEKKIETKVKKETQNKGGKS